MVVGDQDGVLQVFSIKKEDTQIQFKSLPSDKIIAIQMGGATGPGNLPYKDFRPLNLYYIIVFCAGTIADKIFAVMDNKVRAFNKKGKQFLSFDLNLTETIKSMYDVVSN